MLCCVCRTSPHLSINTGVYLIKQWNGSQKFFAEWFRWYSPAVLNDQFALNHVVRRSDGLQIQHHSNGIHHATCTCTYMYMHCSSELMEVQQN